MLFRSRAKNFLFDDNNEQWLKTSEEKLCFFINLHNFLVLFGLCKRKIKTPPETQLEWTNFLKSITVNVSNLVFSAFEIHHSILRSLMPDPVMPNPSLDNVVSYPKYTEIDKKSTLAYDRKDALINFGIYLATKSSPALRIYNIKKISAQMKANAVNYLMKTIKIESNKAVLTLPEMLDWYKEDFIRGNGANDLMFFIANCLKKEQLIKFGAFLNTNVSNEVKYAKYNWNFAYEYIEDG